MAKQFYILLLKLPDPEYVIRINDKNIERERRKAGKFCLRGEECGLIRREAIAKPVVKWLCDVATCPDL
jgi:hypothetical protein